VSQRDGQLEAAPPVVVETASPEETFALGAALGRTVEPGDVFLLAGPFGAGKTVFVQGLARGLEVPTPVSSPSFVLASEHQGRLPLVHIDLFRLESIEPALLASLDEYLESDAVCAIEWPERLPVPPDLAVTRVAIEPLGERRRRFTFAPANARLEWAIRQAASVGVSARQGQS